MFFCCDSDQTTLLEFGDLKLVLPGLAFASEANPGGARAAAVSGGSHEDNQAPRRRRLVRHATKLGLQARATGVQDILARKDSFLRWRFWALGLERSGKGAVGRHCLPCGIVHVTRTCHDDEEST